jgi:hypothetical protein
MLTQRLRRLVRGRLRLAAAHRGGGQHGRAARCAALALCLLLCADARARAAGGGLFVTAGCKLNASTSDISGNTAASGGA